ncbi:hypothetical protein HOB10_05015 [Candidatus Parcubacteria bacterium]|jgi:type II secretory pathway pseudopilin PulG|nr:hypothetical protein [Candidatus Parcubacteria bacterium]
MIKKISITNNGKGFTLIETLVYIFVTSMILMVISSLVMNVLNVRKKIKASNEVQNNARFVMNFINNNIHNVDTIINVSPDPDQLHFYKATTTRFSLHLELGNLVYRETEDVGAGFPDQSTATPIILNTNTVVASNFVLSPTLDSSGSFIAGTEINFVLTSGNILNLHGYSQQSFDTFMSIR